MLLCQVFTGTSTMPRTTGLTCARDQGVNAIESLMERQGGFDYILLETSGLADPGNIAPLFWVDDGLGSTIYLDGIVTVVDAKNIVRSLESPVNDEVATSGNESHAKHGTETTAHLQISHADIILLNKTGTVAAGVLDQIKDRIQSINGLAKVVTTEYGQVPELQGTILDLHAYEDVGALPASRWGHSHLDPVRHSLAPERHGELGTYHQPARLSALSL